jgi:uncharacterized membrane protein YeiH
VLYVAVNFVVCGGLMSVDRQPGCTRPHMVAACTLCIAAITCFFGGVVRDRGAAGQPLLWEDKGREGGRRQGQGLHQQDCFH